MSYPEQSTWAGGWSIFVGACLALIAAGSFVAFSLVARDAGTSVLAGRIEARRLTATSLEITVGEPPRDRERRSGDRRSGDRVGPGRDVTDMVLGTRFFNPLPTSSSAAKGTDRPKKPASDAKDWEASSTRPPTPAKQGETKPGSKGGSKGRSKAHRAPEPNGAAKGHDKARGKGHDKHPGDH